MSMSDEQACDILDRMVVRDILTPTGNGYKLNEKFVEQVIIAYTNSPSLSLIDCIVCALVDIFEDDIDSATLNAFTRVVMQFVTKPFRNTV